MHSSKVSKAPDKLSFQKKDYSLRKKTVVGKDTDYSQSFSSLESPVRREVTMSNTDITLRLFNRLVFVKYLERDLPK